MEGIGYFETFAPVIGWQTVWTMLILSLILNLATLQVDYTAAFVHVMIDTDVYVKMPKGFGEPGKVLKLWKLLYRLNQSPCNFFLHLKSKLETYGFCQSNFDPCMFISPKVICLVYVDNTLFFSPDRAYINKVFQKLCNKEMDLEIKNDVAGFLGVHIEQG